MRPTIAGKPLGARLSAIGCATMTVLASASVAACTGGTPSATPTSLSPGGSPTRTSSATPTPTASPSVTATATETPSQSASASASETPTPSPSPSPSPTHTHSPAPSPSASAFPTAAPETGGGGTAGFQDTLLAGLGGAAILAGAGSIVYRRRVLRNR